MIEVEIYSKSKGYWSYIFSEIFSSFRILQSELRQNELAIDNQAIEQELVRQYFNDQSRPINRRRAQFGKSRKVRLRHCVERHIVFSSRDWVLTMEGCFHCHALFGQHVDQDAELRSISSKYKKFSVSSWISYDQKY